ncbi:unnamed protein product [Polarella glacialis]|uniref:NADAR domain-containing protein n=1 Tax=Polarella glacialis TaxID=89957 RepID=A0A813L2Z4_POLGL|nr:unnamed protein product [Polarella glacialis]
MGKRGWNQEPREELGSEKVLGFYGHHPTRPFCEFSNFYWHDFEFTLPEFARRQGFDSVVRCETSEKAIMLTKAALMGDLNTFIEIKASHDPSSTKALGRRVKPFDARLWDDRVQEVAFQVVLQKFASSELLKEKLLSTGDKIIAEAAPNDRIWGIGMDCSDPRLQDPAQWQGQNILGSALMRARTDLRSRADAKASVVIDLDADEDTEVKPGDQLEGATSRPLGRRWGGGAVTLTKRSDGKSQ